MGLTIPELALAGRNSIFTTDRVGTGGTGGGSPFDSLIPGLDVKIHFTPVKANDDGEKWEIACAQLCGLGHYRMRGEIHVHKKGDFEKWLVTEPKAQSSIGS